MGVAGVQIGKQLASGSRFPGGTASGCAEEAEPRLQLLPSVLTASPSF